MTDALLTESQIIMTEGKRGGRKESGENSGVKKNRLRTDGRTPVRSIEAKGVIYYTKKALIKEFRKGSFILMRFYVTSLHSMCYAV